ncbi:hypothetical protein C5167_013107 [Papaver somniferum]|uniref:DNA polymerase delta catalytic subunit n=1 Tax=Papaver somniferum TaxID=3469 RepID=A0A4Y7J3B8_PAPSO|nr:hypothetical protein C5167_013107 [Papaver somniferum]
MNNNKRRGDPPPSSAQAKRFQQQKPPQSVDEYEEMDEDIEETLLLREEEEALIRKDEEERGQVIAARLSKWKRPNLSPAYISQSKNIIFQQLEIDYVIGERHKELLSSSSGGASAAILRIFGVTREGHSVCCHVHGFEPYFYINCPPGMTPDVISRFRQALEARMRETNNKNNNVSKLVLRMEIVQKRSIMYYQQVQSHPFLKIVLALPTMVAGCRSILEKGIHIDGLGSKNFITYESNVLFALRFMIDCNIIGGNWIELPAGKYKKTIRTVSSCQLEIDCLYSELISHPPEGEFSKMAPFRILSFDIECAGRKGHFPEAIHDPVIQVANLVTLQGEDQPFVRNIMALKSCSPIVGVDVMSFETEREVLLAWRRAAALKITEFPILGRIRNSRTRVKDATFSSRSCKGITS